MAFCVCGVPIRWATDVGSGDAVRLEAIPVTRGPRYREVNFQPLRVEAMKGSDHLGYPEHVCRRTTK